MFRDRFLRLAVFVTVTLWTLGACACNVPVFRYALERWEADPYEVIVFYREPLTTEHQALLESIEQQGRDGLANLVLSKVKLSDEMPQPWRAVWEAQDHAEPPWMVVNYPRRMGIKGPVWAGPLSARAAGEVLNSPVRRDIAQKLLRGETAIWLLLESGDKRRDDEAAQLIAAESRKLEQTLELPELSPLDPQINADLPLRIAFSSVRLSRSNPAERLFINMLLGWDSDLMSATEPMLFPIFGRGRVVPPAIGEEIQAEAIRAMAEFLTGACSCQVKEMNPGYDILLGADWMSLLSYGEVMVPELPLVGMSQFGASAASNSIANPDTSSVTLASAVSPSEVVEHGNLVRNLAILLGIGVAFLAIATLVIRSRANRNPR